MLISELTSSCRSTDLLSEFSANSALNSPRARKFSRKSLVVQALNIKSAAARFTRVRQPSLPDFRLLLEESSDEFAMSKARVYTDVNVQRPKEYWDYEALTVQWG